MKVESGNLALVDQTRRISKSERANVPIIPVKRSTFGFKANSKVAKI